ncbi:MAG: hypothetical protein RR368_07700 [Oscillospiraceae bacterium]
MNTRKFSDAMSEIDDKYVEEAVEYNCKNKKQSWLKWGAMAACLTVALAIGIPYLSTVIDKKGGPGQDDPLRPLSVIEYNGAYYEAVDMGNTELLDTYNLPHEITAKLIGAEIGRGFDNGDKQTKTLYQYVPYAEIAIAEADGDKRFQRAVYVVSDGDNYTFALFCNYIHFDRNTHQEASEMFAVYGVDSAGDISKMEIGGKEISDHKEIEAVYNEMCMAQSMGNDDYGEKVYGNMDEAEQQKRSNELADSMMEIRMITRDGLVIKNLNYYPEINFIYWGLNYYELTTPKN